MPGRRGAGRGRPGEPHERRGRRLGPRPEERAEREARDVFERVGAVAAERGGEVDTEAIPGHPATAVVDYADEEGFDYVASTGRTSVERFLLGSVAETVVGRSPVPVTVVR